MLADYKEGRMDEVRRAALHAEFEETRDAKDVAQMLEALRRGFRRKRKGLAGLDDDDVSGQGRVLLCASLHCLCT